MWGTGAGREGLRPPAAALLLTPPTLPHNQPHFQIPTVVPAEEPVKVVLPTKNQEVTGAVQPPQPGSAGSPSPSATLSQSIVPPEARGHNGSVRNGTPQRMSIGGDGETISPYINGGIINKRFSYSGSLVSESLDLSTHRESLSVSSRVSLSAPVSSLIFRMCLVPGCVYIS